MNTTIIKCVIIEDEDMATKLLLDYIDRHPLLNNIGVFDSPVDFLAEKENLAFDLLFLDIFMPEMTGVDLLKIVPVGCEVIITSASPDFALDCYSLNVIDYLLKPFRFERFMEACEKAIKLIRLKHPPRENNHKTHMMVKVDKRLVKVKIDDILYIEAAWEYLKIHTKTQCLVTLMQIKQMEEELEDLPFFRIHRSYIINLNHINYIEGNIVGINNKKLPISRNYKQAFMKKIS